MRRGGERWCLEVVRGGERVGRGGSERGGRWCLEVVRGGRGGV